MNNYTLMLFEPVTLEPILSITYPQHIDGFARVEDRIADDWSGYVEQGLLPGLYFGIPVFILGVPELSLLN